MTTRREWEAHLYRAITGNRLGHRSYTVANAMRAIAAVSATPWTVVGVSRETWRRWGKGTQNMLPANRAGLLAALRRLRLSKAREARLRQNQITVDAYSNYDNDERKLGPQTLGWQGTDAVIDAYLQGGISAAVDAALQAIGSGHFAEWMAPEAHGSAESYAVDRIDLTQSPPRGASTRGRKRKGR